MNYGSDPAAAAGFVRTHASIVVRGNHDNAIGFGVDCGCSLPSRLARLITDRWAVGRPCDDEREMLAEFDAVEIESSNKRRSFFAAGRDLRPPSAKS